MPQRLPSIDQSWASLAARGFQVGAQGEIDKNNRDRDTLNNAAAALAGGIIRKKTTARQDKIRAEENAREDAIRKDRYDREDARHKVEDDRSDRDFGLRQETKDLMVADESSKHIAAAEAIIAEARDPAAVAAAMAERDKWSSIQSASVSRLTAYQKAAMASARAAEIRSMGQPVLGEDGTEGISKVEGGWDYVAARVNQLRPPKIMAEPAYDAERTAAAHVAFGDTPAPKAPVAGGPVPPVATPPTAGRPQAEAPPPGPAAAKYQQFVDQRLAIQAKIDEADVEIQRLTARRASDGRPQVLANQDFADANKVRDARARLLNAQRVAENNVKTWEVKAKEEQVAQAKDADRTAKVQQVAAIAKTKGPFVTGAFLRALKEGVTDPQLLMSVVVGAMKPEKAPKETPEQKAASKVAEETALIKNRRNNNLNTKTGDPLPTEEEWQAAQSTAGQKRYATQVGAVERVDRETWQRKEPQWEEFPTDELTGVMNDSSVSPEMRKKFAAEFYRRYPNPSSLEKVQGAVVSGMTGGDAPKADAKAEAPAKPGGMAAAKAAFNNLPASERDTPEKARAAKARIMAEYGVR